MPYSPISLQENRAANQSRIMSGPQGQVTTPETPAVQRSVKPTPPATPIGAEGGGAAGGSVDLTGRDAFISSLVAAGMSVETATAMADLQFPPEGGAGADAGGAAAGGANADGAGAVQQQQEGGGGSGAQEDRDAESEQTRDIDMSTPAGVAAMDALRGYTETDTFKAATKIGGAIPGVGPAISAIGLGLKALDALATATTPDPLTTETPVENFFRDLSNPVGKESASTDYGGEEEAEKRIRSGTYNPATGNEGADRDKNTGGESGGVDTGNMDAGETAAANNVADGSYNTATGEMDGTGSGGTSGGSSSTNSSGGTTRDSGRDGADGSSDSGGDRGPDSEGGRSAGGGRSF